eukprot:COSAG04_NODE_3305_length_2953_cov_3.153469_2_plen_195_part_00
MAGDADHRPVRRAAPGDRPDEDPDREEANAYDGGAGGGAGGGRAAGRRQRQRRRGEGHLQPKEPAARLGRQAHPVLALQAARCALPASSVAPATPPAPAPTPTTPPRYDRLVPHALPGACHRPQHRVQLRDLRKLQVLRPAGIRPPLQRMAAHPRPQVPGRRCVADAVLRCVSGRPLSEGRCAQLRTCSSSSRA